MVAAHFAIGICRAGLIAQRPVIRRRHTPVHIARIIRAAAVGQAVLFLTIAGAIEAIAVAATHTLRYIINGA